MNDQIKTEAVKAKGDKHVSLTAGFATDALFTAAFAWLGGVAFHRGFGVSVPFMAAWILLLTGLYFAQYAMGQLARVWHSERVKADTNLIAATMAAQEAIQDESVNGLKNFLASLDKPADKDNGAYL